MRINPTASPAARLLAATALVTALGLGCTRSSAPEAASAASGASASSAPALHSVEMAAPSNGKALPPADYRADIKFKNPAEVHTSVKAGTSGEYTVVVTNKGNSNFPAFANTKGGGAVNLTCRTYKSGPKPQIDGGCNRFPLPADLAPGASVEIKVSIPFPKPGAYDVHIELVHENLNWFEQMGSPSLIVHYQVK